MQKDIDRSNEQRKAFNAKDAEPFYFREGDIRWVHLGINNRLSDLCKEIEFSAAPRILESTFHYGLIPLIIFARPPGPPSSAATDTERCEHLTAAGGAAWQYYWRCQLWLDKAFATEPAPDIPPIRHGNIRGSGYFH